jgi:branched-chain amino acid transport system substrate-binding protein
VPCWRAAVLAQSKAPLRSAAEPFLAFAALGNANLNGELHFEDRGTNAGCDRGHPRGRRDQPAGRLRVVLKKLVESDTATSSPASRRAVVAMAAVEIPPEVLPAQRRGRVGATATENLHSIAVDLDAPIHATFGEWYRQRREGGGHHGVGLRRRPRDGRRIQGGVRQEGRQDHQGDLPAARQQRLLGLPRGHPQHRAPGDVQLLRGHGCRALRQAVRRVRAQGEDEADRIGVHGRERHAAGQGKSALGTLSSLHYLTLDNPENKKFVADYRAKFNEYPSVYSEYGYIAARIFHLALQQVDGNTQDKDKLRAVMRDLKFNAPRGPFRFNPVTQSPIQNVYIREVAEVDGRVTNKVIHTVREVVEPPTKT